MSVYFCIPSCRPVAEAQACLDRWRDKGYKTAVLRQGDPVVADLVIPTGEYLGWARSTNILQRLIFPDWDWVVAGGDDYWPEPTRTAGEIANECYEHFGGTYGVMQPTGDRWGETPTSAAKIDQFAGSPWMGRAWCERSYLGNGPMWDGYRHCFADNELQAVAEQQGVFWQRRDLTQFHDHPARTDLGAYKLGHLAALYHGPQYRHDFRMFEDRTKRGFPGSERWR